MTNDNAPAKSPQERFAYLLSETIWMAIEANIAPAAMIPALEKELAELREIEASHGKY